jgi:hypothetical protein
MFPFNQSILVMSVWTGQSMNDTKFSEVLGKGSELSTTISLNIFNFTIELQLNHRLKLNKGIKGIRFFL